MKNENEMIPSEYKDWLSGLSRRYRQSQIKAATAVNVELLKFYWSLGADILRMEKDQPWGSGFMQKLSADMRTAMPEAKCFSPKNLYYIRSFYELYVDCVIFPQVEGKSPEVRDEFLPQVGAKSEHEIFRIPWGHHKLLIDKFRNDPEQALFYVRETLENGWSRAVLLNFLDTDLYARKGKAVTNFALTLPAPESDLAKEITKDPYDFSFLALTETYRERELKDALIANVEKFLLELGQGFTLAGREYRLLIGETENFADLLFFHVNLNCYVVVEVKIEEFKGEHLGQLGLYVSAVNHLLRKPHQASTIGLLICKTKDNIKAQWALEGASQPMGVSEYQLSKLLPDEVKSDLPSIAEIEGRLNAEK